MYSYWKEERICLLWEVCFCIAIFLNPFNVMNLLPVFKYERELLAHPSMTIYYAILYFCPRTTQIFVRNTLNLNYELLLRDTDNKRSLYANIMGHLGNNSRQGLDKHTKQPQQ